jgi:hypothetical protein
LTIVLFGTPKEQEIYNVNILGGSSSMVELLETIENSVVRFLKVLVIKQLFNNNPQHRRDVDCYNSTLSTNFKVGISL